MKVQYTHYYTLCVQGQAKLENIFDLRFADFFLDNVTETIAKRKSL
jgi:hypothetical protein